jgi:ribonuclease HI
MAWYVVYRGKEPGVYRTWAQCNAQVSGFKNNSYKSFPSEERAVASYMEFKGFEEEKVLLKRPAPVVTKTPCLFVVCMVRSFVLVVLLLFIVFSGKKCM